MQWSNVTHGNTATGGSCICIVWRSQSSALFTPLFTPRNRQPLDHQWLWSYSINVGHEQLLLTFSWGGIGIATGGAVAAVIMMLWRLQI